MKRNPVLFVCLCSLAASFGLFLGTANPVLHIPGAILFYPASLYVLALYGSHPFRWGWCAGWPGAAAALYWIAVAAHTYGAFPWPLAVPCSVLLGMYVALWGGLFAWGVSTMRHFPLWRRVFGAALLWMLLEWCRGWFATGFPWLTVSSGLAAWPILIQPLALMGTYAYSGFLTAVACLLGESLFGLRTGAGGSPRRGMACFAAACCLLGAGVGFGAWRMAVLPERLSGQGEAVAVTMIQGNIRQDVKWTQEHQRATLEKYIRLSMEAVREQLGAHDARQEAAPLLPREEAALGAMGLPLGSRPDSSLSPVLPDMILWPETAMPFAYPGSRHSEVLRAFARELGIPLMFGVPGVEFGIQGERRLFNRAVMTGRTGDLGSYDKEHLVPFGEYLPPVLDWKLFEPLLQGLGGFTAGGGEQLFLLEPAGRSSVPMGMLICYEAVFPELARQRVADGAQILLNISNDAWYDFTSAPMQHLHLSLMRAVEQGRWVARSTNSGITAFLDPLGGVHALGGRDDDWALFRDGSLTGTMLALRGHTPYFYLHPWLPPLAAVLLAALWLPPLRRTRRVNSLILKERIPL